MNEQLRNAYEAKTKAERDFINGIQRVVSGDDFAKDELDDLARAATKTHKEFMKAAEPFLRRGKTIR